MEENKKYSKIDELYLELTDGMKCVWCGKPAAVHTLGDFYEEDSLEDYYVFSELGWYNKYPAEDSIVSTVLCDSCKDELIKGGKLDPYSDFQKDSWENNRMAKLSVSIGYMYLWKLALVALSQKNIEEENLPLLITQLQIDLDKSETWCFEPHRELNAPVHVLLDKMISVSTLHAKGTKSFIQGETDSFMYRLLREFLDRDDLALSMRNEDNIIHYYLFNSDENPLHEIENKGLKEVIRTVMPEFYRIATELPA